MIYLDNAATTRISKNALKEINIYSYDNYANSAGAYGLAHENSRVLDEGREILAGMINCSSDEIYYTSGGTEGDNWAIKMVVDNVDNSKNHIITTKIEHQAVLKSCEYLQRKGVDVTYVGVDKNGIVRLDDILKAIRKNTALISVMTANNEIGTLQPIDKIGYIAKNYGIIFHTDAVQAFGHIPIDVKDKCIDILSVSGHKFGGPKGTGFIYVNKNVKLSPFMHGGSQESGMRAGTLNVPGIAGMISAAKEAHIYMKERMAYEIRLRDYMINRIIREIPLCRLNGDRYKRLPNNINISFENVESSSLITLLDDAGICASSGSACSSHNSSPSHVLNAIGLTKALEQGTVRFTLSHENSKDEIDYTVDKLKEIVGKLRKKI